MPPFTADLIIDARWTLPMTERGLALEDHSLVVGNGRIVDLLPQPEAKMRYGQVRTVQRPNHVLLPGLIDAHTRAAASLFRSVGVKIAQLEQRGVGAEFIRDALLLSIADMLSAGITCFGDVHLFPGDTAKAAAEQGIRARIGLPISDVETPWARRAGEYIGKALSVRDDYKGHPLVTTAFALHGAQAVCDDTLVQVRTLADELDAAVTVRLHKSSVEVRESIAGFGLRPIERLDALGMLTPALNAVHMVQVTPSDMELAQRGGITVTLCPETDLKRGNGISPMIRRAGTQPVLALGSDAAASHGAQDLWSEARIAALMSRAGPESAPALSPLDALTMATRGGALALGLSDQIGALESGKWADVCCVDLDHPAMQPMRDPFAQLLFGGGRGRVCDVWVAGRQLLSEYRLSRLDWPELSTRVRAWAERLK
jgi:5-methylthioadenosine/S-adenosylhomocysteine deaminase